MTAEARNPAPSSRLDAALRWVYPPAYLRPDLHSHADARHHLGPCNPACRNGSVEHYHARRVYPGRMY